MVTSYVPGIVLALGTQRSAREKPQPAGVSEGGPQLTDVAVLRDQCQGERKVVTEGKCTTRCLTHYKLGGLSGPLVISVETSQHDEVAVQMNIRKDVQAEKTQWEEHPASREGLDIPCWESGLIPVKRRF